MWSATEPSYFLCVPSHTTALGAHVRSVGRFPECDHMQRWLPDSPRGCGIVVDVGASIGVCTLLFASLGFRVVALDANEFHIRLLRASVAVNGFRHVSVLYAAVADAIGEGRFVKAVDGAFSFLVRDTHALDHARGYSDFEKIVRGSSLVHVPVTTVDAKIGEHRVCFLKIDAEGADMLVLRGARRALDTARFVSWESLHMTNRTSMANPSMEQAEAFSQLEDRGFTVRLLRSTPGSIITGHEAIKIRSRLGVFMAHRGL
eukprot:gnl/TRDRNA2_/TRDRNA2_137428_c0_seq1.p1 gnl/TRDRNA2_/TRDRNA2_137428_c0~~gnl/TRDRNA2_/TRDRNA2_137428_c0_seq1.p1  ORF type:complete len:296 (+),score=36.19 gnl/TRDRNA2_/TRDRNA2_137428_c0_seq1:110-889(+)